MRRQGLCLSVLFLGATLLSVMSSAACAQMRRSGGEGPGAPPGEAPKGIPRDPRHPYAGVWQGTFTISRPTGGEDQIPIVMVLSLVDSTTGRYAGFTVLPNGARAPHEETAVANGAMQWKQENSGGGYWLYVSKLVARDSLTGTVMLENWPQLAPGEKPPAGSIALVRRPPAS